MIIILSPAKTLDFESPLQSQRNTEPRFLNESKKLVAALKKMAPHEISTLMGISDKLGVLNHDRYQEWNPPFTLDNARQAIFAFRGDVYSGFNVEQMNATDLQYAQQHLRILSGLYGLLRPMDLIQPYRLEMSTRWVTDRYKNLYEFWGDKLTIALNHELHKWAQPTLINLASNEYYKVLKPRAIEGNIITPVFKDFKNGSYKTISFFAKKARGMMAAKIITQKIEKVDLIKTFNIDGYLFSAQDSDKHVWVFKRK